MLGVSGVLRSQPSERVPNIYEMHAIADRRIIFQVRSHKFQKADFCSCRQTQAFNP
jgi:hypothetical protein